MAESKTYNVETFPIDSQVDITITGEHYKRLSEFMIFILLSMDVKDTAKYFDDFAKRDPNSPIEYHLDTIIGLMGNIENTLREKGLVQKQDITIDAGSDETSEETPDGN